MSRTRKTRKTSGPTIPDAQRSRPRVSVSIEPDLYAALVWYCRRERSSRSKVIDLALRAFFEQWGNR